MKDQNGYGNWTTTTDKIAVVHWFGRSLLPRVIDFGSFSPFEGAILGQISFSYKISSLLSDASWVYFLSASI